MDKHKSYGFEGGYEDWTSEKVFSNMRIGQRVVAPESDEDDDFDESYDYDDTERW